MCGYVPGPVSARVSSLACVNTPDLSDLSMQMTYGKMPYRPSCSCEPDPFDLLPSIADDEDEVEDATESDSDSSVDSNDAMDAGYDADASNDVSSDDSFDATDSAYNADASNDSSADSQATIVIGDSEDSVQFLYEVRPVGLTLVFAESVTFEPEVDGH